MSILTWNTKCKELSNNSSQNALERTWNLIKKSNENCIIHGLSNTPKLKICSSPSIQYKTNENIDNKQKQKHKTHNKTEKQKPTKLKFHNELPRSCTCLKNCWKIINRKCSTLQEIISIIDCLPQSVHQVGNPHLNPHPKFSDYFMQKCKVYQMVVDSIRLNIERLSTNED